MTELFASPENERAFVEAFGRLVTALEKHVETEAKHLEFELDRENRIAWQNKWPPALKEIADWEAAQKAAGWPGAD